MSHNGLNLDHFPTLKALEDRIAPEILQSLFLDYQRMHSLMSEIDAERRTFKLKHERVRMERDVLQTALLGVLSLGGEERLEAFLEQSLEIVARLAGAEVAAFSLRIDAPDGSPCPLLITRHCTDADLAFVQEELTYSRGILRLCREQNRPIHLPGEADSARLLDNLRQRHVRAAIALPFSVEEADGVRGVLYLEHMTRADAFSGDLKLVHESLRFVSSWLTRAERNATRERLTDHTAPYRRDGRYAHLAGRSQPFAQLLAQLELFRTTRSESPVMLIGEPGVGKEMLAETLHQVSPRAHGPFVVVRCGEGGDATLADALFGEEQAVAYNSSSDAPRGALERARGGTLFLRDIDRLSPALQSRMYRMLQERRFYRNHGEMPVRLEVRIISSSCLDLTHEVQQGRFRADLADRLSLIELRIPALRDRREDILPLAGFFLAEVSQQMSRPGLMFAPEALRELERRVWAGNLEELKNLIRAAVAGCTGKLIEPPHLEPNQPQVMPGDLRSASIKSWKVEHDEFQRRLIRLAMELSNRNVTQAARKLKISRQYLNNRLRTLGMGDLRASADINHDMDLDGPDDPDDFEESMMSGE